MFKVLCLAVLFVFVATRSTGSKFKSLRVNSKGLLRHGRDLGEIAGTEHPTYDPSTISRRHSGHYTGRERVTATHGPYTTNKHTGTDRSTGQHFTNTKRYRTHHSGSHHTRENHGTTGSYRTTEKYRATTKRPIETTKRYASME
ncbi:uncharacterized protein LOC136080559 [Hydra vulgaris]|uniref:Uncharacterized protein LOC136080559 n=1 Tax=Hydra vulgaris TaxID=6087 RepID=A0ABM4BW45_HYDVU